MKHSALRNNNLQPNDQTLVGREILITQHYRHLNTLTNVKPSVDTKQPKSRSAPAHQKTVYYDEYGRKQKAVGRKPSRKENHEWQEHVNRVNHMHRRMQDRPAQRTTQQGSTTRPSTARSQRDTRPRSARPGTATGRKPPLSFPVATAGEGGEYDNVKSMKSLSNSMSRLDFSTCRSGAASPRPSSRPQSARSTGRRPTTPRRGPAPPTASSPYMDYSQMYQPTYPSGPERGVIVPACELPPPFRVLRKQILDVIIADRLSADNDLRSLLMHVPHDNPELDYLWVCAVCRGIAHDLEVDIPL